MSTANVSILDQLVLKAGQLYSLPAVAVRVLQLTDDPKVDTRALKECIENDPALTTKILRVVNSSLFGLSREVSDLNQAIALLGTKPLKLLVLGFSLPAGFFAELTSDMLGRYWRHTLTKAVAAREISATVWEQLGDEAFIAGLLQDLGMLALIQDLGTPYLEFLDKVRQRGADLSALEIESLGFDHTELSSRLLDHWGLPKTLAEAVRREAPDAPRLVRILALAELVAAWLADERPDALEQLRAAAQREGMSTRQLEDIVATLEEKVKQLADVLSLRLPQGRDYFEILVQAHERLAETAAEAAGDLLRQQHSPARGEQWPDAADRSLLEQVRSLNEAAAEMSRRTARTPAASARECASPETLTGAESSSSSAPAAVAAATTAATVPTRAGRGGRPRVNTAAETDPGVLGQLAAVVVACRQSRCALSLLSVELNDADDLVLTRGVDGFGKLRQFLETTCRSLDHSGVVCLPQGDAGFVLILPDCDRTSAVHMGNLLIDRVRRVAAVGNRDRQPSLSLSVGVATVSLPPRNFPASDLLTAADRCLYGSRASGGGVVKSIEIY